MFKYSREYDRKEMGDDGAAMQTPMQCELVDQLTIILAQFIIFDRDVLFEFFHNDDKLRLLFESVYIPIITQYYNQYANSLNETAKRYEKLWKTRTLLINTWRGKGIKIFSDYMKSIHQLYEVFSHSVQISDTSKQSGLAFSIPIQKIENVFTKITQVKKLIQNYHLYWIYLAWARCLLLMSLKTLRKIVFHPQIWLKKDNSILI